MPHDPVLGNCREAGGKYRKESSKSSQTSCGTVECADGTVENFLSVMDPHRFAVEVLPEDEVANSLFLETAIEGTARMGEPKGWSEAEFPRPAPSGCAPKPRDLGMRAGLASG